MYPMIISMEELWKIKEIIKGVKEELDAEKVPYKRTGTGNYD